MPKVLRNMLDIYRVDYLRTGVFRRALGLPHKMVEPQAVFLCCTPSTNISTLRNIPAHHSATRLQSVIYNSVKRLGKRWSRISYPFLSMPWYSLYTSLLIIGLGPLPMASAIPSVLQESIIRHSTIYRYALAPSGWLQVLMRGVTKKGPAY